MPRIIHVGTKRPMARKHSSTGGVTYPKSPNDAARRRAKDRRYEAAKTKYLVGQRAAENKAAREDAAKSTALREKATTERAKIAARSALASAYVQSGRTPPTGTMSTGGDSQQNKAMQAIAKRKRVGERALKYESALKQRGGINPKRSTGAKLRPVSSFAFNAPVADVERVAQQHGITAPQDIRDVAGGAESAGCHQFQAGRGSQISSNPARAGSWLRRVACNDASNQSKHRRCQRRPR